MGFFQNTCKPKGLGGKIMVKMMNSGHGNMIIYDEKQLTDLLIKVGFTNLKINHTNNNWISLVAQKA